MKIRIIIADDHGVIRAGLRALLNTENDMQVVAEAADGRDALRLAEQCKPDIVLMDLSMPGIGGIDATRRLKETLPAIRVFILTVHEDEGLLREAIRAGAAGYVVKRAAEAELMNAIRAVYRGDMYIHPAITRALIKDLSPQPATNGQETETLTERENDVLRLLARGYTNKQIGESLGISTRTVEGHRSNLMGKLDLHSRVELVEYAEQHGLLETGKPTTS